MSKWFQVKFFRFFSPHLFFSYISVVSFFSVILRSILQHNFMKYKLLVLDLDGTLTNKQKKITPHTTETLLKIQEQGVKIVLASGRPT